MRLTDRTRRRARLGILIVAPLLVIAIMLIFGVLPFAHLGCAISCPVNVPQINGGNPTYGP
jgi:hypothetical protein